jgi:hypothetical protein
MEGNINPEDLKNAIIIIALDNLASLYEYSLEENQIDPENIEEVNFLINYARSLITEMGGNISSPHKIQRPIWKE